VGRGLRLIVVIGLLVAGLLGIQQYRVRQAERARERADLEAGLAASRVLSETFGREASLRVATLSGSVLSQGGCTSAYVFANGQRTVAPFAVAYSVDLKGVDRSRFRWDAAGHTMFVELPDVQVEPPAIDIAKARSSQSGVFISRACGLAMQGQIAGRLQAAAGERAHRADHLAEARASARSAVAALVQAPLAAAGVGQVTVRVRFPFDPQPNDQHWDVSRSIDDVLHNRY
jgi:hypothetical protein